MHGPDQRGEEGVGAQSAGRRRWWQRRRRRGRRALPHRRQQPGVQGVLRASRVDRDGRRAPDQRDLRVRVDDGQDPHRAPPPGGDRRLGRRHVRAGAHLRALQGPAPASPRPAVGAVAAPGAARGGVRLPQREGRGLGGGRRDCDPGPPRPTGGGPRDGRLRRPRRLSGGRRRRAGDDDVARRHRDEDLRPRGGDRTVRRSPRAGPGPDRAEGRHLRQHPRGPGDRRQDRRPAPPGVRLAGGGAGQRRQDLGREAQAEPHRARRRRQGLEAARHADVRHRGTDRRPQGGAGDAGPQPPARSGCGVRAAPGDPAPGRGVRRDRARAGGRGDDRG